MMCAVQAQGEDTRAAEAEAVTAWHRLSRMRTHLALSKCLVAGLLFARVQV